MTSFSGTSQDLAEKITYELEALEYLRRELFYHSEQPDGSTDIILGDFSENGSLLASRNIVISDSISANAVGKALSRLKPLAFSACFKIQDMLAEWILRSNGCNEWAFSKKISAYEKLKSSNKLVEPDFFLQRRVVSDVFWELYQSMVKLRNPIAHSGGTRINADGAIEIRGNESALILTHSELGSYIRSMCIIANHHIDSTLINPHLEYLLNYDLSILKHHHNIPLSDYRTPILTSLNIEIPTSKLESIDPIKVIIDFDMLHRRMLQIYSPDDPSRFFYSTHVSAPTVGGSISWLFPIEKTPFGLITLAVGDEELDKYLVDS